MTTKATTFPYLAFLFILGVFLFLPLNALADISQGDSGTASNASTGAGSSVVIQYLGTGITGTFGAGDFYVERTGGGGTMVLSTYVWECTTVDPGTRAATWESGGSPTDCTQRAFWEVFPIGYSKTLAQDAALNTTVVADENNYYYLQFQDNGGDPSTFIMYGSATDTWSGGSCITTACGAVEDVYFVITGISGGSAPLTHTRIDTVTPPDDPTGASARATSTTFAFEATGYVNASDWREGMRLIIRARNNVAAASNAVGPLFSEGGNALCSWLPDWLCPPLPGEEETYTFSGAGSYEFSFPITAAGDFSVATTTDVQTIGRYTMFTTIEQPNKTFFGLSESYSQFVSTTTQFTVATSSSYDRAIGSTVEAIVASQTAIDPECSFDFFTPSNYLPAIQTCITSIFAVPTAYVADGLMGAMSDLLSHAPWGYATRVYVILTEETASSTLPTLAVDVPDGLPMGGTALPDFSPWAGIETAVAQLDVADVETMEGSPLENFEFWWNFMWSLMFAFWVIREIYGMAEMGDFEDLTERMGMAGGRAHGRIRKASNGQRYQEYTNADVKRAMRRGSRKGVIH